MAGAPKQGQVVAGPADEIPAAPGSRSPPWNRGVQRSSARFSASATWLATLQLAAGNTEQCRSVLLTPGAREAELLMLPKRGQSFGRGREDALVFYIPPFSRCSSTLYLVI